MMADPLSITARQVAVLVGRLCAPRLTPIARAAERHERSVVRTFLAALRDARNAVDLDELQRVLSLGHSGTGAPLFVLQPALQALADGLIDAHTMLVQHTPYRHPGVRGLRAAKTALLPTVLRKTMQAGAAASVPKLDMKFDAENPAAIAWAEAHAAELVKNITDDAQDAIRVMVVAGFDFGIPPRALAPLIRSGIGLRERDANAVMNKQLALMSDGTSASDAAAKAERYAATLISRRAKTIARTETMRASNEGQTQLWKQAREIGLLTGTEQKVWITADPCDICEPLEGETVGLDDEFSIGDDPPAHPNCRCTIGLVSE